MLFLILSPFAAFALLMAVSTLQIALLTAGSLSLALLIADRLRGRSAKALQLAAAASFAALGFHVSFIDAQFSAQWARAVLDGALLAVGLASLLLRAPFTLQYARERVPQAIADHPGFRQTNYRITAVWTIAFVAMFAADLASVLAPWLPLWTGIAVALLARNGAAVFTQWYTGVRRRLIAESIMPAAD